MGVKLFKQSLFKDTSKLDVELYISPSGFDIALLTQMVTYSTMF